MALTQTQVSELYVAIFNRASEGEGNKLWQDQGWDMAKTATEMLDTGVAKDYFGTSLDTNQAFIEHIYKNTLNKTVADDADGIANWVAQLDSHAMTKGEVVAAMIDAINTYAPGGENYDANDAKTVEAYQQFENRVTVSDHMADTIAHIEPTKAAIDATTFSKGLDVTADPLTVTSADQIIDNMAAGAITLTENPDTVSGNIINADRVWNPGGTDQLNSLNDDDKLTGTGDNPTLNATIVNDTESSDLSIMPELNGIETVNVKFTADVNQEIDLQDATGIKNLNATRIDNNVQVTFDNIQETLTSATVANSNDNFNSDVIFDHRTSAVAGDADSVALTLDDVQMRSLRIDDGANNGYETINLKSTGDANVISQIIAEDLETLNITGDKDLTVSAVNEAGSLNLVDASGLEANLDFTLVQGVLDAIPDGMSNGDIAFTLKSAGGDDVVRIAGTVGATDTIEMSDGKDTLVVQAINPTDNYTESGTTITGVEAVELLNSDADDAVIGILADEVDGDQTFTLRNDTDGAGNKTTYNIANLSEEEAKSITIEHSGDKGTNPVASSNALANNIVNLDMAADVTEASITIGEGVNTDPRFNFQLGTDSDTSIDAVTGALVTKNVANKVNAVTSLTINDTDSESNTVQLQAVNVHAVSKTLESAYTDTITIKGGQTGTFMDLDATANLYQHDQSGLANDKVGIQDVGAGAAERLIVKNFDATEANSNVIARFSNNLDDKQFGGQTIKMGSGNDTVIFDNLNDATAGLTISDTVSGGEGHDVLAIDGHVTKGSISLGESEWTHVSGMDELRLVGNNSQNNDNNGSTNIDEFDQRVASSVNSPVADEAGYNITLTDGFIDSTDNGENLVITNDSNNNSNIESSATIDARGLNRENHFSYDGEENAGSTVDVFKFSDASMNGGNVIDGGDENTSNVASQNSDVIEIWDTAIVTAGDLANIENIGGISFRSDSTVAETLTLTLTDKVLDAFDSSHTATSDAPETISILSVDESNAGNVGKKAITVDISDVTICIVDFAKLMSLNSCVIVKYSPTSFLFSKVCLSVELPVSAFAPFIMAKSIPSFVIVPLSICFTQ